MKQAPCDFSRKNPRLKFNFTIKMLPTVYILEGIMFRLCNSISDFKNKFILVWDSIYIVIIIPLNSNFGNINGYK